MAALGLGKHPPAAALRGTPPPTHLHARLQRAPEPVHLPALRRAGGAGVTVVAPVGHLGGVEAAAESGEGRRRQGQAGGHVCRK